MTPEIDVAAVEDQLFDLSYRSILSFAERHPDTTFTAFHIATNVAYGDFHLGFATDAAIREHYAFLRPSVPEAFSVEAEERAAALWRTDVADRYRRAIETLYADQIAAGAVTRRPRLDAWPEDEREAAEKKLTLTDRAYSVVNEFNPSAPPLIDPPLAEAWNACSIALNEQATAFMDAPESDGEAFEAVWEGPVMRAFQRVFLRIEASDALGKLRRAPHFTAMIIDHDSPLADAICEMAIARAAFAAERR